MTRKALSKGLLGALLMAAPSAFAAQVDLGGGDKLYPLLQRPAGARALALGGAFEAVADDPSAQLWNPAAPVLSQGLGLSMHHETWLAGTDREVLSAQAAGSRWWGLGLYGSIVNYAGTQLRDSNGAALGTFTPREESMGANLALRWGQATVGLGGRYMLQQLPGFESSAMAGDLGLLWDAAKHVRLASVLKLQPVQGGGYRSSGNAALSLGGTPGAWRWLVSSTVRLDPATASELDLGVELGYGRSAPVALRAGYSQGFPSLVEGLDQRFSVGAGAGYGQYQLDYAFIPWGSFGATHRLSLSFAQPFSTPTPVETLEPTPLPTPAPAASPTALREPALSEAVPSPAPLPEGRVERAPAQTTTRFRVLSDAVVQARAMEAAGQPNAALRLYHEAATADPDDLAAWQGLAKLYVRGGQGAFAKQCWQQVLRLDPADPDARAALGQP